MIINLQGEEHPSGRRRSDRPFTLHAVGTSVMNNVAVHQAGHRRTIGRSGAMKPEITPGLAFWMAGTWTLRSVG